MWHVKGSIKNAFVLLSLLIFNITFFSSIVIAKSIQLQRIEGEIVRINKNILTIFNFKTQKKENYFITSKTNIKFGSLVLLAKGNKTLLKTNRLLKKGYDVLVEVNAEDQTLIKITVKEIPR
ncbi:hypothetical protein [Hippea sp. KM1]|uniref:hypothetical protein n=1 Tax=Hippea sp. KM1 TaxID=944481 RepID=UPI00046CD2A1|nr:hypothetical protein [Hippea sp. KM1]